LPVYPQTAEKNDQVGEIMMAALLRSPRLSAAALWLLLLFPAPAALAQAKVDGDNLSLTYKIYVAGSSVYEISYDARLSPAAYQSVVDMGPNGLGKLLTDYRLNMSIAGEVVRGRLAPQDFTLRSSKRRDLKSLAVKWDGDGRPQANRSFRLSPTGAREVEDALAPAVPDPLTAVLRHSLESSDAPCARTQRVYNGFEVYDLEITYLGEASLKSERLSAYRGPAFKCRVVLVPIAGYSQKKMRKYLKQPPTYTVWFAPVEATTLARRILIPVAATGRAAGRNFSIVVSRALLDGQAVAAAR
jgi:hypothetical protein